MFPKERYTVFYITKRIRFLKFHSKGSILLLVESNQRGILKWTPFIKLCNVSCDYYHKSPSLSGHSFGNNILVQATFLLAIGPTYTRTFLLIYLFCFYKFSFYFQYISFAVRVHKWNFQNWHYLTWLIHFKRVQNGKYIIMN